MGLECHLRGIPGWDRESGIRSEMDSGGYFEAIHKGDEERLARLLEQTPELLQQRAAPHHAPDADVQVTGLHAAIYAGHNAIFHVLANALTIRCREVTGLVYTGDEHATFARHTW